ncbi:hypothetical protein PybrP1_011181 [[Pythium] brassicae (nom. inval.)]|nr:hypothetical protein PybrP1_011181 [[Pythium] brassicae (nom. inval.)]
MGREQADVPTHPYFAPFDPVLRIRLTTPMQELLWLLAAAANSPYPLNGSVAEIFAASALLHIPEVSKLFLSSPYVAKVSIALNNVGIAAHRVQMWGIVFRASMLKGREKPAREKERGATVDLLNTQSKLIHDLLALQNAQVKATLDRPEQLITHRVVPGAPADSSSEIGLPGNGGLAGVDGGAHEGTVHRSLARTPSATQLLPPPAKMRYQPRKHLHSLCFLPLFLLGGYDVVDGDLLAIDHAAEKNVLAFLRRHGETAASLSTFLSALKRLNRSGAINDLIAGLDHFVRAGRDIDSSSPEWLSIVYPN